MILILIGKEHNMAPSCGGLALLKEKDEQKTQTKYHDTKMLQSKPTNKSITFQLHHRANKHQQAIYQNLKGKKINM